jgi:hypothetical protein
MSVSLWVSWQDGKREEVLLSPQHAASVVWADVARRLNLKHYDGVFPMYLDKENLEEIIAEFGAIRDAVGDQSPGAQFEYGRLSRLIDHLERLKSGDGWEASIG